MGKIKTVLGSALAVAWLRQVSSSNTLHSIAGYRSQRHYGFWSYLRSRSWSFYQ